MLFYSRDELRKSTDQTFGDSALTTEKRLQRHTEWLKSVKRDTLILPSKSSFRNASMSYDLHQYRDPGYASRFDLNSDMELKFR